MQNYIFICIEIASLEIKGLIYRNYKNFNYLYAYEARNVVDWFRKKWETVCWIEGRADAFLKEMFSSGKLFHLFDPCVMCTNDPKFHYNLLMYVVRKASIENEPHTSNKNVYPGGDWERPRNAADCFIRYVRHLLKIKWTFIHLFYFRQYLQGTRILLENIEKRYCIKGIKRRFPKIFLIVHCANSNVSGTFNENICSRVL